MKLILKFITLFFLCHPIVSAKVQRELITENASTKSDLTTIKPIKNEFVELFLRYLSCGQKENIINIQLCASRFLAKNMSAIKKQAYTIWPMEKQIMTEPHLCNKDELYDRVLPNEFFGTLVCFELTDPISKSFKMPATIYFDKEKNQIKILRISY
jgi:hypothetical protein